MACDRDRQRSLAISTPPRAVELPVGAGRSVDHCVDAIPTRAPSHPLTADPQLEAPNYLAAEEPTCVDPRSPSEIVRDTSEIRPRYVREASARSARRDDHVGGLLVCSQPRRDDHVGLACMQHTCIRSARRDDHVGGAHELAVARVAGLQLRHDVVLFELI